MADQDNDIGVVSGFDSFLWSMQNLITRSQPFTVEVPTNNNQAIDISKQFPRNVTWIYGISLKVIGVGPSGQTLITPADSERLFLNLQIGTDIYFLEHPMNDFVYWPTADGVNSRDRRYWPCKIPGSTDVDVSTIKNPTSINSGLILFTFLYV